MKTLKADILPGYTGKVYIASLPKKWANNPNCQRAISKDLYKSIIANPKLEDNDQLILSDADFNLLQKKVLGDLDRLPNSYHTRWHTEEVIKCVEFILQNLSISIDANLLKVAALFHDYGHSGENYRQLSQADSSDMSNEEFAALVADNHLKNKLSISQRLELQGLILATSFGQISPPKTHTNSEIVIKRDYLPTTAPEKLLAFADIGRFMLGPEHHLEGSLKMLAESKKTPENFNSWLKTETGFIKYVQSHFNQIKKYLTLNGTESIQSKLTDLKVSYAIIEKASENYQRKFEDVIRNHPFAITKQE